VILHVPKFMYALLISNYFITCLSTQISDPVHQKSLQLIHSLSLIYDTCFCCDCLTRQLLEQETETITATSTSTTSSSTFQLQAPQLQLHLPQPLHPPQLQLHLP